MTFFRTALRILKEELPLIGGALGIIGIFLFLVLAEAAKDRQTERIHDLEEQLSTCQSKITKQNDDLSTLRGYAHFCDQHRSGSLVSF